MDKDEVHMYTRILLSHKAEWTNAMCNMDGPGDGHTKWSKSDKDKYDIVDMQNLKKKKNDTDELIYKIETDSQT